MKKIKIKVENLKCHGCANTIAKGLRKVEPDAKIFVDIENSFVEIEFDGGGEKIAGFQNKLKQMGYPSSTDQNDAFLKAKSYVSCAIGRL